MDSEFKQIMSLNPEKRNIKQIHKIVEKLSHVTFFSDLKKVHGKQAVKECCAQLTLQVFEPGDSIITYREVGEEFFVILEGSAKVYAPVEFEMTGTKEEILDYHKQRDTLLIPSSIPGVETCDFYETKHYDKDTGIGTFKVRLLNMESTIETGISFGELALINNKPRSATIKANTNVVCAVLTRKSYEKIIKPIEEKILNEKISFLKSFPFLNHLSKQTLSRLTYKVEKIPFSRGNTVYNEGERSKGVYLVYKGEFQIYKRLDIFKSKKYEDLGHFAKKIVKRDNVPLVTVLEGQYFGAYETMKKPYICENSVKCISPQGEVWFLTQKYILEESSLLTKRRMRESGQMLKTIYAELEKEAIAASQVINKPNFHSSPTKEARQKTKKIKELLKMTMIDKYPMSLPAAMKNVVYDLETNSKAYKMLLNKTDQMAQNFNFIQELEKNLEENGDLQRKKAKAFSLTRAESSPNFLFTNKSPENLSNITNEISMIKNSIVEQDRRRTLAKSRLNQPFSRNESSLQESNTMNKLTHRTNTLTKIFTRDGELPLLHKRTETFTKSGKGREKKGIQVLSENYTTTSFLISIII
ncbi:unnamed protein product [Moneuplotes crassus]|uniref:Cyclic nucleotide-binding domain-containing protein n=1 Tax=Euplotes crassus TaxID=5936 RepID=A0AAD2DAQ9_EUPCR|nr:unnamed protein product [Moneuplotes crassus]